MTDPTIHLSSTSLRNNGLH